MRKSNLIFGLFFLFSFFVSRSFVNAQKTPWDPATETGTAKVTLSTEKSVTYETLNDLKTGLEKTYKMYANAININSADLYLDALSQIEVSRPLIEKKPASEEARATFAACSLLTEAAILQLHAQYNESQIATFNNKINKALNELAKVHETISYLERSKASRLKVDLDAEKLKAQKLREEAERKFHELQSSLIQVRNDARGTIISMSDILFEVDKAKLTPDLKTSLAKIAGILLVFKASNVIVEGHTDNQGSAEYNQKLSERRAENVMNFLVEQGIVQSRLTSVGYGLTKPIADNTTKEGRQKNRRVDLIIQEKKSLE